MSLKPLSDTQLLDFFSKHHTLHKSIEILYVVDGVEATLTDDDHPVSDTFKGANVREALTQLVWAIDPPVTGSRSLFEKWSTLGRGNKLLIASSVLFVCAVFAPAVVKHVEKSANAIMQANEKNFVDSVLEKPESKFYLSAELTKGFLDGMTMAKNAGIKSAELRGLIGGFFNCENEFDIGGLRTQRSAFNVNVALHCQDILPIKELVVKKRPGGIVALYTDKAYQDMQDQSAVELGLKIYTAYLTAYSARFNRDQFGTTNTADMQKFEAILKESREQDFPHEKDQ